MIIFWILISFLFNGNNFIIGSTPPKLQNNVESIELIDQAINNSNCSTAKRGAERNGWTDSFDNDSYIEFQESINISDNDVKLNSTDLFLITTTADFDAGKKYYIETNSDNPSVLPDEFHIVANNTVFTENFEGIDEQDLDVYDPNWVIIKEATSTTASAKIDTGQQVTGSSSVRFYATNGLNRLRAEQNIGTYTTISTYIRADGPSNPSLHLMGQNGNTVITQFSFYGAFNLMYYDGGIKTDTGYDYSFKVWYKIETVLDFTNQQYDIYIDGGAYNDFLIVDDANFRNPTTSANTVRIDNMDAWSEPVNPDSYGWYDDLIADKFQYSAIWESAPQSIPDYQHLEKTTITYSGLVAGASEIDKVQWLVDDVIKATYETDIDNNALSPFTIFEGDLTTGSFTDIDSDFTIRIYLTSDGVKAPKIYQLEGSAMYKNGTLISNPITIPTNNVWDRLAIGKTEPSDAYINVSVLNSTTTQPIPGFSERTGTSIDLSAIDTLKHTTIKLQANLSSESLNSPLLHNWSLFWKPDPPRLTTNIPSDPAFPEDTDADNLINLGNYFDDVWTPDDRLLFEIIYESDATHINASIDGLFLDFTTPTINWSGSETFRIKCTDEGGLSVNSNMFLVTVTEVNDPPVWSPIDDIYIEEDSGPTEIVELDDYIYDCDDVIGNITYYIISNDNPSNILAEITDRSVFAKPIVENYIGEAIIVLNANDGVAGTNTSFLIIITPVNDLPTVELLSPTNNSIITTATVKLTWTIGFDVDSAIESYDVYLDDVDPPQTRVSHDQTVTSFSIDREDGDYYWTVIPYDGVDDAYWDSNKIWMFTVAIYVEPPMPPPAITLASPYNNSILNSTSIELIWNGNTSYDDLEYFIYFDTEPAVNEIIASEFTDTKLTWSDLEDGVTYYWSVIPISQQVMGICKDGIWSFTVQLDFVPHYKVEIIGIEYLKMNQNDQQYCNITVTNKGNVRDIYIPELDASLINDHVKFTNIGNIILDRDNSSLLQILITLPPESQTGDFNITVHVSSFWGGKTVNDTHRINVKIEPKTIEEPKITSKKEDWVELIVWTVLFIAIILILIAIALIAQRRKRKLDETLTTDGIAAPSDGAPVLLPDIISQPGEVPRLGAAGVATIGALRTVTPVLKSAVNPTISHVPTPQLAQPTVAPQLLPPAQPGVDTTVSGGASPTPTLAATPMQTTHQEPVTLPEEIFKEEKLDLLEERFLRGEVDLETYKELKTKIESSTGGEIPEGEIEDLSTIDEQPPISQVPPEQPLTPETPPEVTPQVVPQVEPQSQVDAQEPAVEQPAEPQPVPKPKTEPTIKENNG